MFPMCSGLNFFQRDSPNLTTFPLWGHLMFPSTPYSTETSFPEHLSPATEMTMTINDGTLREPQTKIKLKPLNGPVSLCWPDLNERVSGLMCISLQYGSMKFAVVLCTKEEGFPKGSQLELPKSWKHIIREDTLNANIEGNVVRRTIRCGDEIILKALASYTTMNGIEKKEPMDLSVDMKSCSGAEGFSCDRCGKVFSYSYYRDKHLKYTRCVDRGDRKFPCSICPRSFEKRDRLRIHILHVHENHRPHLCSVCGKAFSQSSSLNKHHRVHSGERPYKCPFCPKAFTASSILRTHVRQHSGEKPFKCAHCGKAFASHAAHDSHVRRTHGIQKD